MRKLCLPVTLLVFLSSCCHCGKNRNINKYFEQIRNNTAELTAFFGQMPKGGDLHNHFTGSVYGETYISYVVAQNYYIDTVTLAVGTTKVNVNCLQFSQLRKIARYPKDTLDLLATFEQRLMQKWSVKDYNGVSYPSDKQFFETFNGFWIANNTWERYEVGLKELKARAVKEHVTYIETMFKGVSTDSLKGIDKSFNSKFADAGLAGDTAAVLSLMQQMYDQMPALARNQCVDTFNNILNGMHTRLHMDDSDFTIRYQTYVARVVPPATLFENLVLSFESANTSPLVVGVNIVAPEDNEVSMRDYWMHMLMFKFCHEKYPNVKYAMHAGELTLGIVKPEELTWHINAAVRTAGASRIGHGVDMAYENNCYDLLKYMAKNNTAIEINLYSNEFILKVKNDRHPFSLYRGFGVPIVICTDDAGVLRSNLTDQYVLLASRYKDVSYQDIKKYVYNSISYSFADDALKAKMKAQLDTRFADFERMVIAAH